MTSPKVINSRSVINVDIDNVIYPWTEAMYNWLLREPLGRRTKWPANPYELPLHMKYTQWAVWEDWNIPKGLFMREWREAIESGFMYDWGNPIEGAVEALWRLSDDEYHIRLITDRLNHFSLHKDVVVATVKWLDRHSIPYRSLSFDGVKTTPAEYGIDDRPANVIAMKDACIKAACFDAPHNQDFDYPIRVTWADDIITQLNNTRWWFQHYGASDRLSLSSQKCLTLS